MMTRKDTHTPSIRTLTARYVFPVTSEPIPGGVVTIEGERIAAVKEVSVAERVEDLGNVAILPGLVNAHAHLEFSDLREPLGEPGMGFTDWIRRVIEFRPNKPGHSAGQAVRRGLQESLQCGTTTLGEIAQPGWPVEQVQSAGLDTTVFLELIAPAAERVGPALELARGHLEAAKASARRDRRSRLCGRRDRPSWLCDWHPGLSPHAPYSVHPELLARLVSLSAGERVPIALHLAESSEELELLRSGGGPFREFLGELGTCDPGMFSPGTRPLDYLRTLAAAHRVLIIHGNYLDEEEIGVLAEHAQRMAVVYCPRTHAYFGHQAYPLEKMLSAGATVALGTDGRASSPDLSLLAEMRRVAEKHPTIDHGAVIELGTIRAARALGRDAELGSLEPGKYANLAVVALPDREAADPHELLFDSDRPVVATWYRGAIVGE